MMVHLSPIAQIPLKPLAPVSRPQLDMVTTITDALNAIDRSDSNRGYVQNLIDANNRGIGQLVDADLNEESAKLKALQTQEQLAIQALNIANNSPQNILRLLQ